MSSIKLDDNVYWVGVDDRNTELFEGLWPITETGISYNTYLIDDEKKAIIDLTKSFRADDFLNNINEIINISSIDFIVINHMEPDHTGIIRTLKRISPDVKIICSDKTVDMLKDFYGITDNIKVVEDGEELSLGKTTLKFFYTPMVHWPETMMTYDMERKILYSCDAFGGYGTLDGSIFDDHSSNLDFYKDEAMRYYANIVSKYSKMVKRAIEKLKDVDINIIAPSHGRVWRKNPKDIVKLYDRWADYTMGEAEPGITLVFSSMYGNTETFMNSVSRGIAKTEVPLEIFDARHSHVSYILTSIMKNKGLLVGAPTYETSMFPKVAEVLNIAVEKKIIGRKAGYFGSYAWSGGARRDFEKIADSLKWEVIDTYEFKGGPDEEELEKAMKFGEKFAESLM